MYNLLVSYDVDSWNGDPWTISRGRAVREYTAPEIRARFGTFGEREIEQIKSLPCIFAIEQEHNREAKLGKITGIRTRADELKISYEIIPGIPSISSTRLSELTFELDIENLELHRSHWAIKDVNLVEELLRANCLTPTAAALITGGTTQVQPLATRPITISPTVFTVPNTPPDANLISVMMPFGGGFNSVYATIRDACAEVRFNCMRADDLWENEVLIQDIFALIYRSKAVVCDFTGKNPNVFYEAGIAHTLGKKSFPSLRILMISHLT